MCYSEWVVLFACVVLRLSVTSPEFIQVLSAGLCFVGLRMSKLIGTYSGYSLEHMTLCVLRKGLKVVLLFWYVACNNSDEHNHEQLFFWKL
jgi:hypothetical protein